MAHLGLARLYYFELLVLDGVVGLPVLLGSYLRGAFLNVVHIVIVSSSLQLQLLLVARVASARVFGSHQYFRMLLVSLVIKIGGLVLLLAGLAALRLLLLGHLELVAVVVGDVGRLLGLAGGARLQVGHIDGALVLILDAGDRVLLGPEICIVHIITIK